MNYKNEQLIVLKQNKENYQPASEEIISYGEYLGLKFPEDNKMIPMLYEALKAPLPEDWQACEIPNSDGEIVYRKKSTKQISEEHPLDKLYSQKFRKLKAMTAELAIDIIAEETQSWLRESSDLIRTSKMSGSHEKLKHSSEGPNQLINNIIQEKSFYEDESSHHSSISAEVKKIHSARTYRKKNPKAQKHRNKNIISQQKFEDNLNNLKNKLNNFFPKSILTLSKIQNKQLHQLKSEEEIKYLAKLQKLIQNLNSKQHQLKNLRKIKLNKLEEINILQSNMHGE